MNHDAMPVHAGFPIGPLLLVAVVVVTIVIVLILLRRYLVGPNGLSPAERKTSDVAETGAGLSLRQQTPTVSDDPAVEDNLDLDCWLNDTELPGATECADGFEQPEPESPDEDTEQRKKKVGTDKSVDVVGVWKQGHWKPTSVDPSQGAADALKDFFKRH